MKITELLDRPIAFHRVFVTLTGSVKAAIMLSQAVYWQPRAKQVDGWWYKTANEWEEETGLTRHEQDQARKDCAKYLKSDLRGIPATLYWHVDEDALQADLFDGDEKSSLPKSGKLDARKPSNINKNTETTTETTNSIGGDDPKLELPEGFPLDWYIALGKPITQDMVDKWTATHAARLEFERAFSFGKLPWSSTTTWEKFDKWVVDIYKKYPTMFQEYVAWRADQGKYKALSNKQIRMNPQVFMDTGYMEFEALKMTNSPEKYPRNNGKKSTKEFQEELQEWARKQEQEGTVVDG